MWNDQRVELLTKLWLDGYSASQVAKKLGAVTRNAVIGKVHRLGLAGRAMPSVPRAVRGPAKAPRKASTGRPRPVLVAYSEPPQDSGLATILTLGAHMCRWPYGTGPYTYCGRHSDKTYCGYHDAQAHQRSAGRMSLVA